MADDGRRTADDDDDDDGHADGDDDFGTPFFTSYASQHKPPHN